MSTAVEDAAPEHEIANPVEECKKVSQYGLRELLLLYCCKDMSQVLHVPVVR